MSPEQVIRAGLWAVASVSSIIGSFVWAQVAGTDASTILLGGTGVLALCGLVWKLLVDYRATSELIDDYREALDDERQENHRLRDQLRDRKDTP